MVSPINWLSDLQTATDLARQEGKSVLLQFHRDECAGCKKLYAQVYTEPEVQNELHDRFVPVRQDILKNREVRSRFSAYWTPSFYFVNSRGIALYSFNGYLNAEDFRVLLRLGKAALDLPRGRYLEVIDLMDGGLQRFPNNPRAAAMLFTRGMAEYLLGKEKSAFLGTMNEILELYPASPEARMWPWTEQL